MTATPALSLATALPILAPIDLRSLTPADAPAFRAIRLEALKHDGRYFAASAAGSYRRAVVFHRKGNWPSKQLNERFGGRYWRAQPMRWADGQTAPGLWYRIDLAAFAPR